MNSCVIYKVYQFKFLFIEIFILNLVFSSTADEKETAENGNVSNEVNIEGIENIITTLYEFLCFLKS